VRQRRYEVRFSIICISSEVASIDFQTGAHCVPLHDLARHRRKYAIVPLSIGAPTNARIHSRHRNSRPVSGKGKIE
jgi:hypothetical protein